MYLYEVTQLIFYFSGWGQRDADRGKLTRSASGWSTGVWLVDRFDSSMDDCCAAWGRFSRGATRRHGFKNWFNWPNWFNWFKHGINWVGHWINWFGHWINGVKH